jgi:hypothetical protein
MTRINVVCATKVPAKTGVRLVECACTVIVEARLQAAGTDRRHDGSLPRQPPSSTERARRMRLRLVARPSSESAWPAGEGWAQAPLAATAESQSRRARGGSRLARELAVQCHTEVARPRLNAADLHPPCILSGETGAVGAHEGRVRAGTSGAHEECELGVEGVAAGVTEWHGSCHSRRFDDHHPFGPLAAEVQGGAVDDSGVHRDVGSAARLHHEWNATSRRALLGQRSHCALRRMIRSPATPSWWQNWQRRGPSRKCPSGHEFPGRNVDTSMISSAECRGPSRMALAPGDAGG